MNCDNLHFTNKGTEAQNSQVMLRSASSYCLPHDKPINRETSCWGKEQGLYQESQQTKKMVEQCPKEPSCLSQNSGLFYTKKGEDVVVCCKLFGVRILCSCSCPGRSGCDVPLKLQQDKCYSLFCNFLFLCVCVSCSVMSDSLQPLELQPPKLLCPWNSPGKNTRVGCHFLLAKQKFYSH